MMLLRGRWVLAGSGKLRNTIRNGAVYVEDGVIRDFGKYDDISKKHDYDVELGSDNHIVLPGLVNAHQHGRGVSSFEAGIMDCPLELWLPNLIHLYYSSNISIYKNTLLCCIRMIKSGITTSVHHFYGRDPTETPQYELDLEEVIKAYIDSGMRVAIAPSISDQNEGVYLNEKKLMSSLPKEIRKVLPVMTLTDEHMAKRIRYYFQTFDRLFSKYQNYDGRIKLSLGPSGAQWCSDELLRQIKGKAKNYNVGIHMHLLETKYQKECASQLYGKTAVQHLADLDFLGSEVSCAHSIWLNEKDIDNVAQNRSTVVHNPSSNLRLYSGISPVKSMLEKGVHVALGIDGTGFDGQEDMFQEMRLCSLIHREPGFANYHRFLNVINSNRILDMATIEGARASSFNNAIGSIELGRKADIVLVDSRRILSPYMSPTNLIQEILVGRAMSMDVDTVIIDGKVVMKNRQFVKIDEEDKRALIKDLEKSMFKCSNREVVESMRILKARITKYYKSWNID